MKKVSENKFSSNCIEIFGKCLIHKEKEEVKPVQSLSVTLTEGNPFKVESQWLHLLFKKLRLEWTKYVLELLWNYQIEEIEQLISSFNCVLAYNICIFSKNIDV